MTMRLKLVWAGTACLALAGCNPPASDQRDAEEAELEAATKALEGDDGSGEQVPAQQDVTPDFVGALWTRSVDIAKPCENSAAVLADRISFTSPQNALPDAKRGLDTCELAIKKQNELRVPEQASGELAVTLDNALHTCREALDARRKFFEYGIMVLEGDTSRARQTLVRTSSMVAQGRSEDCIALFREAGLEI